MAHDSTDVWRLLEVSADDSAFLASLAGADAPRPNRKRKTLKSEIDYLRAKQVELSTELAQLQGRITAIPRDAIWQRRAYDQAMGAHRALQERAQLQDAVQQQLQQLHALEDEFVVSAKRTKMAPPSVLQQEAVLNANDREAALEALLQRQLEKLDSEWVRHRIYDAVDANAVLQSSHLEPHDDTVLLRFLRCEPYTLPSDTMASVLWTHLTQRSPPPGHDAETFHADLAYTRQDSILELPSRPTLESRLACRRWTQKGRTVIAWRSILCDAHKPHDPSHLIENAWGWAVAYPRGPDASYFAVFLSMTAPLSSSSSTQHADDVGLLTELLLKITQDNREQVTAFVHQAAQRAAPS
ncbi:hypothetical protein SDRG_13998 [Saprolegnia diclina VS20]|uniref:Uncharacterized protein n=1 Tax=Saprolegnia diclina (strain VS20) TaxID=1156394 RepID=T0Q0T8_SAPDV|nr:hypothetical protein SDRG_13998 [Saprolegnia diclina VS20]EQC28171.1 hypothetical protein SDRG_13998 [Saprolegnia diclina VS20]|eukprot:XP_008618320.1 hypothetical protein SDRG_13998 [Saprolegnia diclina VS20]